MAESDSQKTHGSFWTTLPGIITAVAALITATGGLVAVLRSNDDPPRRAAIAEDSGEQPTRAAAPPSDGACFADVLAGIPAERRKILVDGVRDFPLIGPTDPKQGPIALELRAVETPIALVRLRFIIENTLFRIEQIVDAACAPVTDFENASRGGDKQVMQNWDELKVRLAQGTYLLRFGYSDGEIDANFNRIVE